MNTLRKNYQKMSINFNYNYPQLARESGFRLRQYKDGPLDWRLLGSYEIERLLRDQTIEDLDKVLSHLSEAPLGSVLLETNILDPAIAKYFIISQFAIQYLLFCRNFLDETVQELRESHAEAQIEVANLKKLLSEANNEILQLHKKMTQMEAIHEVIYPCHLCTKNFANNEALNIHIGRKHSNNKTITERKAETPMSSQRERNTDLTLINTIKLELEIKQLKERLNNAERIIKERNNGLEEKKENPILTSPTSRETVATRNVGIQSNLSEEKEKNDSIEVDAGEDTHTLEERKAQLEKLQLKIYDIEEWRATQMANNEDSIAEINRKLTDIAQTLESKTSLTPAVVSSEDNKPDEALERRLSVENLERVLTDKVTEIGKASTEKLEEIVHNMEISYGEKLLELECELKKAKEEFKIHDVRLKGQEDENLKESNVKVAPEEKVQAVIRKVRQAVEIVQSEDEANGTYNIELSKGNENTGIKVKESDRTYIKAVKTEAKPLKIPIVADIEDQLSDDTNISESLSDDSKSLTNNENQQLSNTITVEPRRRTTESRKDTVISKSKSPRKYTRKDAKNLADKRLSKFGFDMRMKSISTTSFKRLNVELNEKRNKLKQQYPNIYATRNKIKKFVDKLCTTKSTTKAERLLNTTATMKPMKLPKRLEKQYSTHTDEDIVSSEAEDNDSDTKEKIGEPSTKAAATDDFKKRLERLLASPVQRPTGIENVTNTGFQKTPLTTIADVHSSQRDSHRTNETMAISSVPVAMPRKRVMFDTSGDSLGAA